MVGLELGVTVGLGLGAADGLGDGAVEGKRLGAMVGLEVGEADGLEEGASIVTTLSVLASIPASVGEFVINFVGTGVGVVVVGANVVLGEIGAELTREG